MQIMYVMCAQATGTRARPSKPPKMKGVDRGLGALSLYPSLVTALVHFTFSAKSTRIPSARSNLHRDGHTCRILGPAVGPGMIRFRCRLYRAFRALDGAQLVYAYGTRVDRLFYDQNPRKYN